MDKIKICFLIAGFSSGGAQKQSIYLMNELQKSEHFEVHLICFYEGVNYYLLNKDNIGISKVDVKSFYNPANVVKIRRYLKDLKPDILMSWLHASDVYSFFLKKSLKKLKWVMTERDSFYPFDPRYILRGILGQKADLIVANSQKGAEYWINKGVDPMNVKVVRNILNAYEPVRTEMNSKKFSITYAGRFEPQKNVIVMTHAFCEFANKYPDTKLLIIGEGSLRLEILQIIEDAGVGGQVQVLDFQKNIQDFFSDTKVFVNISHHEGTPNTVIENIQLGNIVLVSNIPEHTDILGANYKFLLNNLDNVFATVALLEEAINSLDDRALLLKEGKLNLKDMSPELITNKYINLFKDLKEC